MGSRVQTKPGNASRDWVLGRQREHHTAAASGRTEDASWDALTQPRSCAGRGRDQQNKHPRKQQAWHAPRLQRIHLRGDACRRGHEVRGLPVAQQLRHATLVEKGLELGGKGGAWRGARGTTRCR